MKKKMLTMFLAFAMIVSVIPSTFAQSMQPQDSGNAILRNPNRYYYTTEYSDYFQSITLTIDEKDAAYSSHVQNVASAAMGVFAGGLNPIPTAAVSFAISEFVSFVAARSPIARMGTYVVSARYKIKYKVDSLDPTKKVPTDTWVEFRFELQGANEEPYTRLYRLK